MGAVRLSGSRSESATALRSPINWAVLGLVIQRPSYGYELVQRFERTYPELELSSRSLIYTALDSLSRRGLIEHADDEPEHDPVRQPKLNYRATEAGIAAYEQWLIDQVSDDPRRSRLIAQHFAALPSEQSLRVLERCAELSLAAVGRLPAEGEGSSALAERLAGEEERLRAGAILTWIEYARSELSAAAGAHRR